MRFCTVTMGATLRDSYCSQVYSNPNRPFLLVDIVHAALSCVVGSELVTVLYNL